MKRIAFSLFGFLLIICGCKQDFDITSDYKRVTIVYGLLNQQENIHYVRIQKGYLIDGNAQVAAGISDSIYYRNVLTVKLQPYFNGSASGSPFTLTRVNGNDLGLPKEEGLFANDSNILYRFTGNLDQNKTYRLEISNSESGEVLYSETALVKDFNITNPSRPGIAMNLQNSSPQNIVFDHAENAGIYDVMVRFHYKEFNQDNNALLRDTFVDILLAQGVLKDPSITDNKYPFSSNIVLTFLSNHLEHRNDIYREFNIQKGMQIIVSAGATELATFLSSQSSQSGLASNEALPVYTNIDGGVGLFSSRYVKQMDSIVLSQRGLDTLACSPLAAGLRFKGASGQICN